MCRIRHLIYSLILMPALSICCFIFRPGLRRKFLCFALIASLIILPSNLALQQLSVFAASTVKLTVESIGHLSLAFRWLFTTRHSPKPKHDMLSDRLAYVARLQISPARIVAYEGDALTFNALPTDTLDRTIQGVKFDWLSSNESKVRIEATGRATCWQPGLAVITCRAGLVTASARVLVRPGRRPRQTDAQWRADQEALPFVGSVNGTSEALNSIVAIIPSLLDKLAPTAYAQGGYEGTVE